MVGARRGPAHTASCLSDMAPYYEALCKSLDWQVDAELLSKMKKANEDELKRLDEELEDAEKNLGESEIRDAMMAKAEYLCRIGDKVGGPRRVCGRLAARGCEEQQPSGQHCRWVRLGSGVKPERPGDPSACLRAGEASAVQGSVFGQRFCSLVPLLPGELGWEWPLGHKAS